MIPKKPKVIRDHAAGFTTPFHDRDCATIFWIQTLRALLPDEKLMVAVVERPLIAVAVGITPEKISRQP